MARAASRTRSFAPSARLVAVFVAALVLFPFLGKSGIWDPYELDTADLARRIAVRVFGATGLELPATPSSLPTLTDLKMGELGFTSMAVGFKLFGLHDWAGRLPLCLWAFASALVLYEFLAGLCDKRTGLYAVIALCTMPLYFMQARTMLGDIVTMSALTMAFCGLAATLIRGDSGRVVWLGIGLTGLVAGYMSRGLLIGIAVPALGIGLTWLLLRVSQDKSGSLLPASKAMISVSDVLGATLLVLGIAAASKGIYLLVTTLHTAPIPRDLAMKLVRKPPVESTFDLTIRQLGHALFPWSAFLPFAIGRMFRAPHLTWQGQEPAKYGFQREASVRVLLLVTTAVAYAAFALIGPYAGALPFSGPTLFAAIAAIAIRDFERGAPSSRFISFGCPLLAFVLYRDFALLPDKALSVFSVDNPVFPKSFEPTAQTTMLVVFVVFAGLVGLSWYEDHSAKLEVNFEGWVRRMVRNYQAASMELGRIWNGNLLFSLVVFEAALVGLGAMLFVGSRVGWTAVTKMPRNFAKYGVNAWWAFPLLLAISPFLLLAARDGFRFITMRFRLPRAAMTVVAGLVAGSIWAFFYYPALAAQLSPKEVFESYAKWHQVGEPLALLGIRSRAAAYSQGGQVESLPDVGKAFVWLTETSNRRWLVVKSDDLPKLNSLYRKQTRRNLPVLDGRSSQILLTSNQLGDHRNENWIAKMVLDDAPELSHSIDAMFEDQLQALGWEITNEDGDVVSSVVPQTLYHLRTYFLVKRPIMGSWKMFIHIDGFQRRYNGDHAVLDGRYAMNLWQPGDVIVDDHEFRLEPNFTPGNYTLYFGFFTGETRFRVTRGENHENRVNAGDVKVR